MVELWEGRRLRPCRAKFCPQVSVVFRLTSGITQVSGHFGGGGVSAWNHPGGWSLRHSWNTNVPPKISREHPPHACVYAHTEAGKSPGVSALASPSRPESPPWFDRQQVEFHLFLSLPSLATHTKTRKPTTIALATTASIF